MKILGINGSSPVSTVGEPRPHGGSTLALLNKVLSEAEAEVKFLGETAEVDVIHLHEVMKDFYRGNYDYLPDWIIDTFRKMIEADVLVFASPVQWYAMSDYMKALINHMTALEGSDEDLGEKFPGLKLKAARQLSGKSVAVIATCHHDGAVQVINSIVTPLNDAGVIIPGGCSSYYNNKNWHAEEGDEDGDWQNEDYERIGQNVARLAVILKRTNVDTNGWLARKKAA